MIQSDLALIPSLVSKFLVYYFAKFKMTCLDLPTLHQELGPGFLNELHRVQPGKSLPT